MLNIAIVGTGWWGTELGKGAKELPEQVNLVGNFSRSAESSTAFKDSFGGKIFSSYDEILADRSVDAVLLATPHSTHRDLAVAAAAAGKHVFCEKPLTLDVAAGREVIAACEKAGVVLAVGHNRRFLPGPRKMKELIDGGACGQILHVEANLSGNGGWRLQKGAWRADPSETPNAGFSPMGIHMVDTFTWLVGPTERLVAISKHLAIPLELDDTCAVMFELKSGATGFVASNIAVARSAFLRIHGTKARLECDNNLKQLKITPADATAKEEVLTFNDDTSVRDEIETFVKACTGEAPHPMKPSEALRNVAFIEAIRQSASNGNSWVKLKVE